MLLSSLGGRRGVTDKSVNYYLYGAKGRWFASPSFSFFYSFRFQKMSRRGVFVTEDRKCTKVTRNEESNEKRGSGDERRRRAGRRPGNGYEKRERRFEDSEDINVSFQID